VLSGKEDYFVIYITGFMDNMSDNLRFFISNAALRKSVIQDGAG
jgi:hypothetical protein